MREVDPFKFKLALYVLYYLIDISNAGGLKII